MIKSHRSNELLDNLVVDRQRREYSHSIHRLSINGGNNDISSGSNNSRTALIMGVATQRSIAWSCVRRFLIDQTADSRRRPWKLILTCQNNKIRSKVEALVDQLKSRSDGDDESGGSGGTVLGTYCVDVADPSSMTSFFQEQLPEILSSSPSPLSIDAVIHSLAFAPNLKKHSLLETTPDDFGITHHISSYSLIDVARNVLPHMNSDSTNNATNSITTLSYLGAERAIPGYNVMGPAKASLESVVRGLAWELGSNHAEQSQSQTAQSTSIPGPSTVRVNAIRAGPISTISSKGGISNFQEMLRDVQVRSPIRRNVTSDEVASTVYHVAAEATGLTGQTINVDGGYSIVSGPVV
jgi:enoyl-[acyl-carrier protein] reductase I